MPYLGLATLYIPNYPYIFILQVQVMIGMIPLQKKVLANQDTL